MEKYAYPPTGGILPRAQVQHRLDPNFPIADRRSQYTGSLEGSGWEGSGCRRRDAGTLGGVGG